MRAVRAVIDTNVFVSGIFFSGPPAKILSAWHEGYIKLSVTEEIIEEYRRVLEELVVKLGAVNIGSILEAVLIEAELVPSLSLKKPVCEDPDDDKFLACAISSQSKYIISGDKHLLKIGQFFNVKIVTPRYFLDNLLS
ncbi:MAG: putative toxin-antitoxin system toxin component, PIN family [Sedimentisphaerales bacterium]|nr:putative toxin-antitoxin system toxin component, PIN family [Sedimentisphaerales bacterium]MBN2842899.1 putative toxin-antitoxin system toxin component, PIN family [Sedimentisphaerales bacterium]